MKEIDDALRLFKDEMVAQGIYDDVVVLTVSDFGRTFTTNGQGSDHGWGGNYFVLGGQVDGGKFLGTYPDSLSDEGDWGLGRGRILPTSSWEAIWYGIAQWFGVTDDAALKRVLPNKDNFGDGLFSKAEMFKS